jgi:hypothetical protein
VPHSIGDPSAPVKGFRAGWTGARPWRQQPRRSGLQDGGLYGAIEWGGTLDARLRALLNVQVATLYGVPY